MNSRIVPPRVAAAGMAVVVAAVKAAAVAPQVVAAAVVAEESGVDAVGVVVEVVGAAFTRVDIPVEELRGISRGPASIIP